MSPSRPLFLPLQLLFSALLAGCAAKDVVRSSASGALTDVIETVTTSELLEEKKPLALPATIAIVFVPSTERAEIPRTSLHKAAEALKQ